MSDDVREVLENGEIPEPARKALTEREREIVEIYDEAGASMRLLGQALGVSASRARVLLESLDQKVQEAPDYRKVDPKGVLTTRIKRALMRENVTAEEAAVLGEDALLIEGIGNASFELIRKHYA